MSILEEFRSWFPDAVIMKVFPPYPYSPNGAIEFKWQGHHYLYKGNKIFDMLDGKDAEVWFKAHKVLSDHLTKLGVKP